MQNLRVPFWIISEKRHVLNAPATIPCADENAAHAFTDTEKLLTFLNARRGGQWQIDQVVDYEGVVVIIAKLHQNGQTKICINPEPDGSGGLLVSIADVLAAYMGDKGDDSST